MKSIVAVSSCVFVLSAVPALAGKWEAIEALPGRSPVQVLVEEKARVYFRVTPEEPLGLTIEGPVRLRIVSRAELGGDPAGVVRYHLRITEGNTMLDEQSTESSASSLVRLAAGNKAVCKSRRMQVDIPKGNHPLKLSLEGTPAVLVRLQKAAPGRGKETMVTLTPFEAARSVLLTEGEKTIPYFSVLPGKPVRLRVVGPTRLELLTRLDFDATMRGNQTYKLAISEGKRRLREVAFKTSKATTATYTNLEDRVPSKFDRVQLTIEEGAHEISVELLEPAQGSVEIHAQIPQPAVGDVE